MIMKTLFFKGKFFLFTIILASCIIIFGMIILNDNVTTFGIIELNGLLNEMNREISEVDYLGMTGKFKLHMELYKDEINQQQFDEKELRVAMIISEYDNTVSIYYRKQNPISHLLFMFTNLVRTLINKQPLSIEYNNPTDDDLSRAYYYERNNYYDDALKIYNRILKKGNLDTGKIPVVMIHKGFCLALLRKINEAKDILTEVIRQYNNESLALAAATLLQYIAYFEQEINKTKESEENALDKSEKLYKLIAYKDALEILDKMSFEDEEQKERILYLKARCYEEVGEKEESLEIYQEIIRENASSEAAKLANSRILIMGTMNINLEKLKKLAVVNNAEIQDTEFTELSQISEQYEEITGEKEKVLLSDQEIEDRTYTIDENEIDEIINKSIVDMQSKEPEPAPTAQPKTPVPTVTPVSAAVSQKTPLPVQTPTPIPLLTPPPNLEKVKKTNEDGSYQLTYNSKEGISYKVEYYNQAGALKYYIEYLYDYDGKIVGVVKKDKNGNIIY